MLAVIAKFCCLAAAELAPDPSAQESGAGLFLEIEMTWQTWQYARVLLHVAGPKSTAKIQSWLKTAKLELPEYSSIGTEENEAKVARTIREAWCKATGQEYIYLPEQVDRVTEFVVTRCLHYTDLRSLDAHDPKLAKSVTRDCTIYRWKDDPIAYRRYTDDELLKIAYTVYRDQIAIVLSDERKEKLTERKREKRPAYVAGVYEDAELAVLILNYLRGRRGGNGDTYNQIAAALEADWGQVKRIAKGMALKDFRVVAWTPSGKKHAMYYYAPERKRITLYPEETDAKVQQSILKYLTQNPKRSKRDVCKAMRSVYLHLADDISERCIAHLIQVGQIETQPGARRAILLSAAGVQRQNENECSGGGEMSAAGVQQECSGS